MRTAIVLAAIVAAFSFAADAQEAPKKTKVKTPTSTLSMEARDSRAALGAFIEAYAAADFAKVYTLLSPDAQADFRIDGSTVDRFFPDLPYGETLGGILTTGQVNKQAELDGPRHFETVMLAAQDAGALPFDLASGAFSSPTFERDDEARYLVRARGEPGALVITTVPLDNGEWRIERIVWGYSDPLGRPWGFK